jgi:hypothetical protein
MRRASACGLAANNNPLNPLLINPLLTMKTHASRWAALVTANALAWCMLCFHQQGTAAPAAANPPFANSVEQRFQIIDQLKQVNAQLKEQNALLRSGTVKVVVAGKL